MSGSRHLKKQMKKSFTVVLLIIPWLPSAPAFPFLPLFFNIQSLKVQRVHGCHSSNPTFRRLETYAAKTACNRLMDAWQTAQMLLLVPNNDCPHTDLAR